MLDIVLSKSQNRIWGTLTDALDQLRATFEGMKAFNYEKRYAVLRMSEKDFKHFRDKLSGNDVDMSISIPRLDVSDLEALDGMNEALAQIQLRRDYFSRELVRSIENLATWKSIQKNAKDLEEEMRSFWMTVDEIKRLKSKELRESEIDMRIKGIIKLRSRIEVYFREGKHRDHGEAMSYEQALRITIENLDAKRDNASRRLSVLGMKSPRQ